MNYFETQKTELAMDKERQAKIASLLDQLNAPVGSSNDEGYGDPGSPSTHSFRRMYTRNLEGNLTANDDPSENPVTVELRRIPELDKSIMQEMETRKAHSLRYKRMLAFRKKLPAHGCRKQIVELILNHQVQGFTRICFEFAICCTMSAWSFIVKGRKWDLSLFQSLIALLG